MRRKNYSKKGKTVTKTIRSRQLLLHISRRDLGTWKTHRKGRKCPGPKKLGVRIVNMKNNDQKE